MTAGPHDEIPLKPALGGPDLDLFRWLVEELEANPHLTAGTDGFLPALRERAFGRIDRGAESPLELRVVVSALCDLYSKGWRFFYKDGLGAFTKKPETLGGGVLVEKERVRAGLVYERDSQLRNENTQGFIKSMERRRHTAAGWCSIYSLMRDGRHLAAALREAAAEPAGEGRLAKLRTAIDPYLQFADDGKDEFTGFPLGDIWRYFRYTWSNAYLSTPGRKFWVLVRDRAAPNHPVVGIASFGNAVVHQGPRDQKIGWTPAALLDRLDREADRAWAGWLLDALQLQFDGVYLDDFVNGGVIDRKGIRRPTGPAVAKLRQFAAAQKTDHGRDENAAEYDRDTDIGNVDWMARARMSLFRWKRAELLATLLEVRKTWFDLGFDAPAADKLRELLRSKDGRRSVELLLRRVKSDHVGIDMLEITTCGALPPYTHVLGGKLVAMLLASPEVVAAYRRFYGGQPSVIASSIAGKPVCRKPNLVYLGTTSLYGVGSSLYNRISIPAGEVGGKAGEVLKYDELGRTEGFGMTHFSRDTSNAIEELLAAKHPERQVNSIFGEGISPRIRKFRVGLEVVGLPSEKLLHHGSPRLVYGLPLAANYREVLLGRQTRPSYLLPAADPKGTTRRIADYWRRRWLAMRVGNPAALAEVERDTLILPVTHRARVVLPEAAEPPGLSLFDPPGRAG